MNTLWWITFIVVLAAGLLNWLNGRFLIGAISCVVLGGLLVFKRAIKQ